VTDGESASIACFTLSGVRLLISVTVPASASTCDTAATWLSYAVSISASDWSAVALTSIQLSFVLSVAVNIFVVVHSTILSISKASHSIDVGS